MSAATSSNHKTITASIVADWLRLLREPGELVELRAIDVQEQRWANTYFGLFDYDHLDLMAEEALRLSPHAAGVYFTLNPVDPDLIARCCNRVKVARKGDSVSDEMIVGRKLLLIDADPQRPAGISATDGEKAGAWDLICDVRSYLDGRGWPAPIVADSGNGYHLLYRIDLAKDDGGIVERCIKALAQRFDTEQIEIDTSVFNPSRISKLYGTTARKGDSTLLRPHRTSAPSRLDLGVAKQESPEIFNANRILNPHS